MKKWLERIFFVLVALSLLAPFWVFKDLLFPYITSKAYYFRIVIELALPLYVTLLVMEKRYRPNMRQPLHWFVLGFLAVNFLSGFFGVNPLRSIWGNIERMGGAFYLAHLVLLYFYVLLLSAMGTDYLQRFLKWFVLSATLSAVYGILVWLKILTFMPDPSYPRISSTFGNPIFFASFLVLPMFVSLFFALYEQAVSGKIWYSFCALLMLVGIVSSATRGATVGVAAGILVGAVLYVILTPSKKMRLAVGVPLLIVGIGLGLLFVKPTVLPKGMLQRMFTLKDTNTEARFIQWKIALAGFHERVALGTGPENYYIVANKYYDPKLYQYDPSWFDKPHNYLLEILVTTGVVGLVGYFGMLIFCVWGLIRAQKAGALSALECATLFTGLVVYEVQNITVFDTIAASIAFFVFLAFGSFVWYFAAAPGKVKSAGVSPDFSYTVLGVSSAVVLIGCYITNITGLYLSKNINYGYAYGQVDAQKGLEYFHEAQDNTMDFDPVQLGDKFADFALLQAQTGNTKVLSEAIDFENGVTQKIANDPTVWQRLVMLYLTQSTLTHQPLPEAADDAAAKALELAPRRPEMQMSLVRIKLSRGDAAGAEAGLRQILDQFPTNQEARMQLALVYHFIGKDELALPLAEQSLTHGFYVSSYPQVAWVIDAYEKSGDSAAAVKLAEQAVGADKNNEDAYWRLATLYAKYGQKDKARNLAEAILQADPSRKTDVENLIKSMQ